MDVCHRFSGKILPEAAIICRKPRLVPYLVALPMVLYYYFFHWRREGCSSFHDKQRMRMPKTKNESGKILPDAPFSPPGDVIRIAMGGEDTAEQAGLSFVFRSSAMQRLYAVAQQVASADASILVFGESGTGKELFARLIHDLSSRNARPFVAVNCGIWQGELFANKFFGHESGAFTGASRQRKGAFEMAGRGTLFLDEVGEIPFSNQTDFLRVLEEKRFRRMGGEKEIPFEARIVAATNRPLQQMVQSGAFRADLFYRLNVIPVFLPPLRERTSDIRPVTEHLLEHFKLLYHKPNASLHEDVYALFESYLWPGNVRELRNLLERLILLSGDTVIRMDDMPLELLLDAARGAGGGTAAAQADEQASAPESLRLATAVKEAEIRAILRAFKHAGGHKGNTAAVLGISERSLRYKLSEYRLPI